jgi:hypothetical protein
MKQFKDTQGRDWQVEINIGQIKAVRDALHVDLYALFADEAERLFSDPVRLVDTLYVLCRRQAEDRKMSDVDFGGLFEGDVLEASANALVEAMLDFFPTSRRRILRATVEKSKELAPQLETQVLERIASLSVTDLLKPGGSPAPSR